MAYIWQIHFEYIDTHQARLHFSIHHWIEFGPLSNAWDCKQIQERRICPRHKIDLGLFLALRLGTPSIKTSSSV